MLTRAAAREQPGESAVEAKLGPGECHDRPRQAQLLLAAGS